MKNDENFKTYEKMKQIVDGLIDAVRSKAAFRGVKGAAVVMGFTEGQLPYEKAGIHDIIAIDEYEGISCEMADAVICHCNNCLKEMAENGAEHFETTDYDGAGTSAGFAALNIEGTIFVVAVLIPASIEITDQVLHMGDVFCPYKVWFGHYDCVACNNFD